MSESDGQKFLTDPDKKLWIAAKNTTKSERGSETHNVCDRMGESHFVRVRRLGCMADRVIWDFTDENGVKIVSTFHAWKRDKDSYTDIPGFSKSASLDESTKHCYVHTPGRYVGAEEVEDDGVPFTERPYVLASKRCVNTCQNAFIRG